MLTPTELLALVTASTHDGIEPINEAMDRAEQIIEQARERTTFQPQPSQADRERANAEDRARMVRRAVQPSRPAAENDPEIPF